MSKHLLATAPGAEVVVAPAGSGKTTLLIFHFCVCSSPAFPSSVWFAITFTRKAAAELLQRLAHVLRGVVAPAELPREKARRDEEDVWPTSFPSPEHARVALSMLDARRCRPWMPLRFRCCRSSCWTQASDSATEPWPSSTGQSFRAATHPPSTRPRPGCRLKALGKSARLLLEEMTFTKAIEGLAKLAECGLSQVLSLAEVLEAVGSEFASWCARIGTTGSNLPRSTRRRCEPG